MLNEYQRLALTRQLDKSRDLSKREAHTFLDSITEQLRRMGGAIGETFSKVFTKEFATKLGKMTAKAAVNAIWTILFGVDPPDTGT